jgi:hypothetical protein
MLLVKMLTQEYTSILQKRKLRSRKVKLESLLHFLHGKQEMFSLLPCYKIPFLINFTVTFTTKKV